MDDHGVNVANKSWQLLVIGASGAIGSAVAARGAARGWRIVGTARKWPRVTDSDPGILRVCYDPLDDNPSECLRGEGPFDAVCWAHGANLSDSLLDFHIERHIELYRTNCLSVLISCSALLKGGYLNPKGARLTITSSIWEERARQDKLSYTVSKAAVGGIVRSAAVDLGAAGHLVNGVLPGVLDTPMTRANLSVEQIARIQDKVPAGRLPDLNAVADTILFLCSRENTSINGQSITVDLGMSNASLV